MCFEETNHFLNVNSVKNVKLFGGIFYGSFSSAVFGVVKHLYDVAGHYVNIWPAKENKVVFEMNFKFLTRIERNIKGLKFPLDITDNNTSTIL